MLLAFRMVLFIIDAVPDLRRPVELQAVLLAVVAAQLGTVFHPTGVFRIDQGAFAPGRDIAQLRGADHLTGRQLDDIGKLGIGQHIGLDGIEIGIWAVQNFVLQLYWVCTSLIRSKSCSSNSVELLASFCGRKEDMIEKV